MSNFKNELNNWQQVPRELVFDTNISDRARFVYVYMACKPGDWDFYLKKMSEELGYSEETTRKYVNELITHGWLSKQGQERTKGTFGAVSYTLHATQISPCREKSASVKNRVGKNSGLYNKELKHNKDKEQKEVSYDTSKSESVREVASQCDSNVISQTPTPKSPPPSRLGDNVKEWWATYCPNLRQPQKWSSKRDTQIKSLLKDTNSNEDDLKKAIMLVGCSSYCQGQGAPMQGRSESWKATLDWLLANTKNCFCTIFDGKYHFMDGDKALFDRVMNGEDVSVDIVDVKPSKNDSVWQS